MKERPILFSGAMIRALLDGRKTQTRRIMKPQPERYEAGGGFGHSWKGKCGGGSEWMAKYCPHGKPGDQIWVRETFCPINNTEFGGTKYIDYRATPTFAESHPGGWDNAPDDPQALKWKPSIFMPRAASRITLEVTGVRVERLNEISEADAQAEGVEQQIVRPGKMTGFVDPFAVLWDSINGKTHPWSSSPWVWVVEFSRMTPDSETERR